MLDFRLWGLRKMLEAMRNWGRWAEIGKVRLLDAILVYCIWEYDVY